MYKLLGDNHLCQYVKMVCRLLSEVQLSKKKRNLNTLSQEQAAQWSLRVNDITLSLHELSSPLSNTHYK